MLLSPSSRRRGLKYARTIEEAGGAKSPPSWRRGLKFRTGRRLYKFRKVASFTEAWIEIVIAHCLKLPAFVASFSEAWIEINVQISIKPSNESPPSRRRGLK